MYVFSLYACIYRKPGRFPFYKSCHVYCNKPIPPSFYKQGNRHLKLQSKMTVSRGHTFFFPYYTCNLSLRVKIPPWHLYCLWLSYVHPLKRGFQKEISRGCKNALSGSQVSCRPGWPLGNQSHSWHFRAAAKPLGNTLTQRPRFAAVMWDAQTGNRTCPKGQEPSDKIGGGTWLPSCQGGNGHEGPCLYALTTQRKGGQLNVYKCHITYRHWAAQFCRAPSHQSLLLMQPRGCVKPQDTTPHYWSNHPKRLPQSTDRCGSEPELQMQRWGVSSL